MKRLIGTVCLLVMVSFSGAALAQEEGVVQQPDKTEYKKKTIIDAKMSLKLIGCVLLVSGTGQRPGRPRRPSATPCSSRARCVSTPPPRVKCWCSRKPITRSTCMSSGSRTACCAAASRGVAALLSLAACAGPPLGGGN